MNYETTDTIDPLASSAPYQAKPPVRGGLGWRGYALLALLAFFAGIAAMIWAISNLDFARTWLIKDEAPIALAADSVPTRRNVATAAVPAPLIAPPVNDDALAVVNARIAAIERGTSAASDNASRAEGLLLAFAARRAIDRGLALGYIEGQLQAHFGATQPRAVGMIIAAARAPVTAAQLGAQLTEIAPRLQERSADATDWLRGARDQLSVLFVVRDAKTPSAAPADRLARARDLVATGRVDLAMNEVARMPGAAAANDWMAKARAHVEANRALDLLEAAAIMTSTAVGQSAREPAQPAPGVPSDGGVL